MREKRFLGESESVKKGYSERERERERESRRKQE